MTSEEIKALFAQFEQASIKLEGIECWSARELQKLLGYSKWDNFSKVINKAKKACINAGEELELHFANASKVIEVGNGALQNIKDMLLTRYACYLIAQNGDRRKAQIAFARDYFVFDELPPAEDIKKCNEN